MIKFLANQHGYTVNKFLLEWGKPLESLIEVEDYASFFSKKESKGSRLISFLI